MKITNYHADKLKFKAILQKRCFHLHNQWSKPKKLKMEFYVRWLNIYYDDMEIFILFNSVMQISARTFLCLLFKFANFIWGRLLYSIICSTQKAKYGHWEFYQILVDIDHFNEKLFYERNYFTLVLWKHIFSPWNIVGYLKQILSFVFA